MPLAQISADPFGNDGGQHATEVEPDTFSSGSTIVSAFQVGRFFGGGASDIGFARSTNGGSQWTYGFLPGLTLSSSPANPAYQRVSDASVAYDARHGTWLVSSIPITSSLLIPTVFVSRSADGATWSTPASIPPPVAQKLNLDKNWSVCDNTTTSPFYGHCYTQFDNHAENNLLEMSTSSDGGSSWSVPVATQGSDHGLAGQPVVQPNGTVIVPFLSAQGKQQAFESTDGGITWQHAQTIANVASATVGGNLRSPPLASAEIDGAGKVYVAWADCRFRPKCSSNDIVFSSSSDGINWSPVTRVPIDPVTSGEDHFIPGLAVDRATSGSTAHLALTYYFYPTASCTGNCRLTVGLISSPDAGAHWSTATQLAGPMSLSDIANTSQGSMVGDYISTSFARGLASTVFAMGVPPTPPAAFDEAMYTPSSPLSVATLATAPNSASNSGVQATSGTGNGALLQLLRDN